jgi:hypothetical protein
MKPATAKQTTSRTAATNPIEKNYVHDNIIRAENIKKENFFHQRNRNESYQLNPYNCRRYLNFSLSSLREAN